jgi:predicted nucleic acid-binding protein
VKVVDASVVLQWLLAEPSRGSNEILEAHVNGSESLIAPELINYEVGNVLVTKVKLTPHDASELFSHFLDLGIETYSLGADEYRASLDLASRYRLTVYDASYLALASALDVRLVTADKRLATRASSLKLIETI